ILRVQLDRVKNLLAQSGLSVEKIADMTGFKNPDYLSVAFKREIGVTPGEYRRCSATSRLSALH
ncbi:MAG: helix-turn-helix domain-containing protein, partial [Limisphaerales bacterium]